MITEFRKRLAEVCRRFADDPSSDEAAADLVDAYLDWPLDDVAFDLVKAVGHEAPVTTFGAVSGAVDNVRSAG